MKRIFLIGFLFYGTAGFANVPPMNIVRALYQKAVTDEKACKELVDLLLPYNGKNNTLLMGYKASGTMIMAKHVFNPFTKLFYFKKGKQMLEKAIEFDGKNVELRFLRFSGQTNIPSFLGYNDNIDDDKKFLLDAFSSITDITLKELVTPALNKSRYLTSYEKKQLK